MANSITYEPTQEQLTFAHAVDRGLSSRPRYYPTPYLYDAAGSKLFEQISSLAEYYLTRTEYDILSREAKKLASSLPHQHGIELIEPGAGDGSKTRLLLKALLHKNITVRYRPIDISPTALQSLAKDLKEELPQVDISPLHANYVTALQNLPETNYHRLILFLGSSIGNMPQKQSEHFLMQIRQNMAPHDRLLVGFDLKKSPAIIRKAYYDCRQITARFNMNALYRMNHELGADFNPEQFEFFPYYNPVSGELHSYLVSTCKQTVELHLLNKQFTFEPWETIHTEVSVKYDLATIHRMAAHSHLAIEQVLHDDNNYFADVVMRPC